MALEMGMDTVPALQPFTVLVLEYYFDNAHGLSQRPAFTDCGADLIVANETEKGTAWQMLKDIDAANSMRAAAENKKR